MNDLVVAAGSGLLCAAAALPLPRLVTRLPEPEPDLELAQAVDDGADLTRLQQDLVDEGPKELYVDMASAPGFVTTLAAVAAAAGAVLGWAIGLDWLLLLVLPLVPIGTLLGVIDLRVRLLPARLVQASLAAAIGYGLVAWPLDDALHPLLRGLGCMAGTFVFFGIIWFISPRAMAYGDVRLASFTGFVLGYLGPAEYAVGLYSPFLLFGVPGLVLALAHLDLKYVRTAYPFGPFLLAGAVLGIALGQQIIDLAYG